MPPGMYPSPNERPKYDQQKPRLIVPPVVVLASLAGIALAACVAHATGILVVNYATPSKAAGRAPGATLTSKVALAGVSRAEGRSPGVNFSSQFAAAASRSNGLAQPATLKSLIGAAPSRSHGLAQPSAIKTIPNAAASRAAPRSPGATFQSQFAAAASRAAARAPGATLGLSVPNFNMGTGLSRASGLAQPGPLKSLIPAAFSRAHAISQPGTLKSLIPSALSRASSRTQPGTLKAVIPPALSRSHGIGAAAFLGGKVSLAGLSRSHGLAPAQLSTHFPTTDIGGAIARDTARSRSTGITLVGYAAASRAVGKAGPATLRFVGAGFDMGTGISREPGGRASAPNSFSRIYYATPMKGSGRAFAAIQLWYDAVPARASGYARCASTLGFQGQQPPTISRGMGGRTLSTHLKLHYATVPSRCTPRALAVLQFAGGTLQPVAGLSRASSRAQAIQLQTLSGPKIAVQGISRAESRALTPTTPTLQTLYFVTPSKADPRAVGKLDTYQETGPSRGMGGRAFASLTSSLHVGVQGLSRQSSRVPGAALIPRQQLVGSSLATSRALGTVVFNTLPISAAPSRGTGVVHSPPMAFLPPNFVTIQGGISRAAGRAVAAIKTTNAAQASLATARTLGTLTSQLPLTGRSRAEGLANGSLALTGPSVLALDGRSTGSSRTVGAIKTTNAGGWIMGHPITSGATPDFLLALTGTSAGHPRAVAVLAFTGAIVQPVTGSSRGSSRAYGPLKSITPTAPSRAHGLTLISAELIVRIPFAGLSRAQGIANGAFENPFASPISRAHGLTQSGLLASALPISGTSLGTGRVYAELTIPREIPHLIFLAKERAFVFIARDRAFVILAKDRRFIFFAGGP